MSNGNATHLMAYAIGCELAGDRCIELPCHGKIGICAREIGFAF
jgi:hypothetical protein